MLQMWLQSVILLIKRRFIPTDMESIWYMSMMPVKSTGHKEMWLTAKHNSLEEKQKRVSVHALGLSQHCSLEQWLPQCCTDLYDTHNLFFCSSFHSKLQLLDFCYYIYNLLQGSEKSSIGLSEADVLLILLDELLIAGVSACSWKRLDKMPLLIPLMFQVPDVPSYWKRGQIPTKYCLHGPAQTLWQAVLTPGKSLRLWTAGKG